MLYVVFEMLQVQKLNLLCIKRVYYQISITVRLYGTIVVKSHPVRNQVKIEKLNKRALRIVFNDNTSTYNELYVKKCVYLS